MSDPDGLCLSRRRITLSTSGVVPMIGPLGEDLSPALAISLHATRDELRDTLVPLNRKYPIRALLEACRTYPGLSNARRITFEYVMLKGVNDSLADARALVRLLKGHPGEDQPHPVQSLARQRLRMLGLGRYRGLLRDRLPRRLRLADPHAARSRHPRRLRPAQEREPEAAGARARRPRGRRDEEAGRRGLLRAWGGGGVTRLILRALIVPIGIGFAAIAALIVGLVGAIVLGLWRARWRRSSPRPACPSSPPPRPERIRAISAPSSMLVWLVVLGILFVPIALVALIGEFFGHRLVDGLRLRHGRGLRRRPGALSGRSGAPMAGRPMRRSASWRPASSPARSTG